MESSRCPVKYKKLVLMPTTWKKARRLVKEKRAVFVKDKVLGVYLKLKYNPIKDTDIINDNQKITLGIDPGTMFDGYTVFSKYDNRNFQYNHQLPIMGKLSNICASKKMFRRTRRLRIRHRPIRLSYRTGKMITNTENYYFQNKINMIKRITRLYPITSVCIEDIRFNHAISRKGQSFSRLEVGKTRLYSYIQKNLNLVLVLSKGTFTKDLRSSLFPKFHKNSNKGKRDFFSHCIDSLMIAILGYLNITSDYNIIRINYENLVNTKVRFIDRVAYKVRRNLHKFKCKRGISKLYFRYDKGGKIRYINKYSKLKKIRTKPNDSIKSNHLKNWVYLYTSKEPTFKKYTHRYGGTVDKSTGISKYWNNKYYKYYNIQIS